MMIGLARYESQTQDPSLSSSTDIPRCIADMPELKQGSSEARGRRLRRASSIRLLKENVDEEIKRRKSSIQQSLPKTTQGWIALLSGISLATIRHEVLLQRKLTGPPLVFGQFDSNERLNRIYAILTSSPSAILRRDIQPSLFVGTRAAVTSTAAYMLQGPTEHEECLMHREVLILPADGAKVALEWEFPNGYRWEPPHFQSKSISKPVVLILHGINNHAKFGYVRSLLRSCTDRGWIGVGMNFRGCGGVSLRTPRGYNGAYTGDLRAVVQTIEGRLTEGTPLFLIGNSLGANLVAKYLGEEGMSQSLPECVAGGVTLGNPMRIHSGTAHPVVSGLLAIGTRTSLLKSWNSFKQMAKSSSYFRQGFYGAMKSNTLASFDTSMAPLCVRNNIFYPHEVQYGYKSGEEYWKDASSYRVLPYVSVPLLQVIAGDDFLVYRPFQSTLKYSLSNPNVLVVESRTGGHLGWHEAPPDGRRAGVGTSWADVVTMDYIDAVLRTRGQPGDGKCDGNSLYGEYESGDGRNLRSRL